MMEAHKRAISGWRKGVTRYYVGACLPDYFAVSGNVKPRDDRLGCEADKHGGGAHSGAVDQP